MKIIKNAKVLIEGELKETEVLFDEEKILDIGNDLDYDKREVEEIDAFRLVLIPGLVDVHVHLREPGFTHKETIKTGTMAAARGGFTTIMPMPNINPYPDNVESIKSYLKMIEKDAVVNVLPYACISYGEKGEKVVDFEKIKELGIKAFSDDGVGVANDTVMKQAMIKAKESGVILACHTEDMKYRKKDACVHDSEINRKRGYIGIPIQCESEQIRRDIELVEETKAKYHVCHVSAKESVELIRKAKEKGLDVTGEVTCHHLLLEDKDVEGTNWKMNPPLREHSDRMALIEALESGSLDFIANDHAPHTEEEKAKSMEEAPFGIVSLETSFPLLYTEFVKKSGRWSLGELIDFMSKKPAKRFGIDRVGEIKEGYKPDFVLVDLEEKYKIDKNEFESKGKNTPFDAWEVFGKVKLTMVGGKIVWKG